MTPKEIEEQRLRNAAVYNSARRIIDGWPEWKQRWACYDNINDTFDHKRFEEMQQRRKNEKHDY